MTVFARLPARLRDRLMLRVIGIDAGTYRT
jgi:hypothetical protein